MHETWNCPPTWALILTLTSAKRQQPARRLALARPPPPPGATVSPVGKRLLRAEVRSAVNCPIRKANA